jgi:hypothetical protein
MGTTLPSYWNDAVMQALSTCEQKANPTYNTANSPIMKNVIILNTTHNTLNHHDYTPALVLITAFLHESFINVYVKP